MAKILDLLKNLFSFSEESSTRNNPVTQLDESSLDEIKTLLKKNKGFLPLSLETNLGSCTRIYDDGLYYGSGPLKSSGLWLTGVFYDKDGRKTFDIPLENFDLKTQEAVLRDVRQAFAVAQKQKTLEGGIEAGDKIIAAKDNQDSLKNAENIIPTRITISEEKNGKQRYRDAVAIAATVKDGRVVFFVRDKNAQQPMTPYPFDSLSLNDKKQLLDAFIGSKVSIEIEGLAKGSYLAHEADFKQSMEQRMKAEEHSQGRGVRR